MPEFLYLDTLSLAYNDLTDIDELVDTIRERVIFLYKVEYHI